MSRRSSLFASDLRLNDLEPTCPHCFEINPAAAVFCQSCGTHLFEQRSRIVIPKSGPGGSREALRGQNGAVNG